jgi:hypothetical protein
MASGNTARNGIFIFLSLVLLFPFTQYPFNIIRSAGLRGATEKTEDIQFSVSKWWDGSYQKQKQLFLNDNVGFRPDMVRLNNQLDFSLFNKLHAQNVYIGKDNYMFDKGYVDEYEGVTYTGTDVIRAQLIKLKMVQDTLERLGKTLVFVYAPSKPYYVPDKIPDELIPPGGKKINNYSTFRRIGDSLHIKQLDVNALFMAMKDTTHNLLMTKQGYHWSVYGSMVAADTLVKFVERERNIKMPELTIGPMHYSSTPQDADDDFVAVCNLLAPVVKERYSYPDYHYDADATKTKTKTIYIGDSFVWQLLHYGLMKGTNSSWEFWYYFNTAYNQKVIDDGGSGTPIAQYNWQRSVMDADCIIAVFTPMNLHLFDDKTFFVEQFYAYFYPTKK